MAGQVGDVESLVSDAAEGIPDDVTWFERLYARHYDDVLRFAVRRVGPITAPDIAAEVFLIAWRRRAAVDRDFDRLWLFGVARKVVANSLRSEDRRFQLTERLKGDEAVRGARSDATDLSEIVAAALSTLPPAEREALLLTEWEQLQISEAAVVAGCSRAAFRVRLHRARRKIANQLARTAKTAETDGQSGTR